MNSFPFPVTLNGFRRYDVSGVPGDRIEKVIKVDWQHLLRDRCILDSPAYLHEDGRPVIALWGRVKHLRSFCRIFHICIVSQVLVFLDEGTIRRPLDVSYGT